MTAASNPKFARKLLDLRLINKAPLKHAHDDEVESGPDLLHLMKSLPLFCSGHSTLSAVPNGTDSVIMHIRTRVLVFTNAFASLRCEYKSDRNQLYYMGRTAEDFAASDVPNGIQRA